MQGLLLLLFSQLNHVPFIHHIETTYTPTGVLRYWVRPTEKVPGPNRWQQSSFFMSFVCPAPSWCFQGNKGGVSVRFSFYGHALCFLNCHLAAHMDYASQRVDEFKYILCTQSFSAVNTPRVLDHRSAFTPIFSLPVKKCYVIIQSALSRSSPFNDCKKPHPSLIKCSGCNRFARSI